MKKMIISIAILVLLSGANTLLFAQGGQRQGRGGRPPQGLRPGEVGQRNPDMNKRQRMEDLKKLERLRMIKLLELLDLDTKTESVLIPHIRKHHKEMFQILRKHQNKIDNLGKGLRNNKLSDEEILKKIDEINKLEMERHERIKAFHSQASEILTAEQLGKLYVFQARFGGEVLEKMSHFRKAQDEYRKRESGN